MTNFFQKETPAVLKDWDGLIDMRSIKNKLDFRELTKPLPCGNGFIPKGFQWNGASSGIVRFLPIVWFPKWRHPIATCRHDWRCGLAKNKGERAIADRLFKADIEIGQENKARSFWEKTKGYLGVRIGAFFTKYK